MKVSDPRQRPAVKGKNVIPLSLKRILGSSSNSQTSSTKNSRPKIIFPEVSLMSDVLSPKAILKSFEYLGASAIKQLSSSTKCTANPLKSPTSPNNPTQLSLKSPNTAPRNSLARSPTMSMGLRDRSNEDIYNSLKERTHMYFTSSANVTREDEARAPEEEHLPEKINQLNLSSQPVSRRPTLVPAVTPVKKDRAKDLAERVESHIIRQKRSQVKNEVLKKILSQANVSNIRLKDSVVATPSENKVIKPRKVIKLKRDESKMLKQASTNVNRTAGECLEFPQRDEENLVNIENCVNKTYKSLRLKYLADPDPEVEVRTNLQLKVRSIVCENFDRDSVFRRQKFTGKFTRIEKPIARDIGEDRDGFENPETSLRARRDREKYSSRRCAEKERSASELIEEMKLANSIMLREAVSLDKSRISKSSIKGRKNLNGVINIVPTLIEHQVN